MLPLALLVPLPVSKVEFLSQPQRSLLHSITLDFRIVLAIHFPGRQTQSIRVRPIFTEAVIEYGCVALSKQTLDCMQS